MMYMYALCGLRLCRYFGLVVPLHVIVFYDRQPREQ